MKSTLLGLFSLILIIQDSYAIEFDVKVGDKIDMCCTLIPEPENGLSVMWGNIRVKMLLKNKLVNQDIDTFNQSNTGFIVIKKNNTVCMVKEVSEMKDDKFSFKCVVVLDGVGKSLNDETHSLRIYEELKFIKKPYEKLVTKVGKAILEECSAEGKPDLQVIWRTESEGKVSSGSSSAILEIKSVTLDMNGMKYTCEASTSIPKGPKSIINQTITLDVRFKPELDIETLIVHTDLGYEETFKIKVKGNPQPKIDCPLLNIPADKIMGITSSDPFSYIYEMKIDKITEENIRNYSCTVSNEEGDVTKQVALMLKPANLKITSPNETSFSNCYMLSWTMNSKSPILNFTVTATTNDNNSTIIQKTITDREFESIRTTVGNKENNWKNIFAFTLFNLTSNQQYKLSLKICNRHECIKFENGVHFTTPKSNGNQCDPTRMNSKLNSNDLGSTSWNVKPTLLFVFTQSIIMFFVPLILQQVF